MKALMKARIPEWLRRAVVWVLKQLRRLVMFGIIVVPFFCMGWFLYSLWNGGVERDPVRGLASIGLALLGIFMIRVSWPGGLKGFFTDSSPGETEDEAQPITLEVLLLAGMGLSVVLTLFAWVHGECPEGSKHSICLMLEKSGDAFLPLLVTLATAPTLIFWWLRRDKHKCQDLKHQEANLNHQEAKQQNDNTRLLSERFTSAVQLLGHENVDVRLGAIYALERLARDSGEDHWTVMETLAAYVRQHAAITETREEAEKKMAEGYKPKPAVDVQAALTVIGRRKKEHREKEKPDAGQRLNLTECDLRGVDLSAHGIDFKRSLDAHYEYAEFYKSWLGGFTLRGAHFAHANFQYCYFRNVKNTQDQNCICCDSIHNIDLSHADFFSADLQGAHLEGAHLEGAHLKRAHLEGADLEGADLWEAHLQGAHLERADLKRAKLVQAHLEWAHLSGAHLVEAYLKWAHLEGADLGTILMDDRTEFDEAVYDSETTTLPQAWGSSREEQDAEAKRRGMINADEQQPIDKDEPPAPDEPDTSKGT